MTASSTTSANTTASVIVADDHPVLRVGLVELINSAPDLKCIGSASSALETRSLVEDLRPDLVVLDIQMADYSGLDILPYIRQVLTDTQQPVEVVIFSMFSKENLVFRALQGGAKGFVTKASASTEVLRAIRHAHAGEYYLSPDISRTVIEAFVEDRAAPESDLPYNLLTEREQEVFHLLVKGRTNKSIAYLLSISERTVEKHRTNLMRKLDVRSFRELISLAVRYGILDETDT